LDKFIREHPQPHLLVGLVPAKRRATRRNIKRHESLVGGLVEALRRSGSYAIDTVGEDGGTAVRCAFERPDDAELFARAVHARPTNRYSGWASQRVFLLDDRARQVIRRALAIRNG
jgi:hypothetical protein